LQICLRLEQVVSSGYLDSAPVCYFAPDSDSTICYEITKWIEGFGATVL